MFKMVLEFRGELRHIQFMYGDVSRDGWLELLEAAVPALIDELLRVVRESEGND